MADDFDDFRAAMSDVVPLKNTKAVVPQQKTPPSDAAKEEARKNALGIKPPPVPGELTLGEVPPLLPRDFVQWKKEGVQDLVMDRLRKGHYDVAAMLDLHGERIKAARRLVHEFLVRSHESGARCVLISHGRGEKSATPARMKSYVAAWLEAHDLVNAFVSATRQLGGTGSMLILLKKSAASKEENRQRHGAKGEPL